MGRKSHLRHGTTLVICKAKHQSEIPDRSLAGIVPHSKLRFWEAEAELEEQLPRKAKLVRYPANLGPIISLHRPHHNFAAFRQTRKSLFKLVSCAAFDHQGSCPSHCWCRSVLFHIEDRLELLKNLVLGDLQLAANAL